MTSSMNRRTLVKGAAWAAPVAAATWANPAIANAASVPQTAASQLPQGTQITSGLYTTVAGLHIGTPDDPIYIDNQTYVDAHTYTPDRNWSDARNMMTGGGSVTNGNGSFTPYGTHGVESIQPGQKPSDSLYAGTGFWFASPTTQVNNTGDYFTDYQGIAGGKTTLGRGSVFNLTVEIEYPNQANQQNKYFSPKGGDRTYWRDRVGKSTYLTPISGAQGSRQARNGVRTDIVFGSWDMLNENGKYISRGTLTLTTANDLTVATASNGAPQFQQVYLTPMLTVQAVYGTDITAIRTIITPVNVKLTATANGQTITGTAPRAQSAWFEGPVCNGTC